MNRLVKVWLANAKERASGGDPLDFVYKHTQWIPDIDWMATVMPNLDEQNDNMQWLKEMIGNYVTTRHKNSFGVANARMAEIMALVGKERNPVHKGMASIEETMRVELIWRARLQKINTSMKNVMIQMHTSELLQWRIAALNIDDLNRQDQLKEKWLDYYKNTHQLETNPHSASSTQNRSGASASQRLTPTRPRIPTSAARHAESLPP